MIGDINTGFKEVLKAYTDVVCRYYMSPSAIDYVELGGESVSLYDWMEAVREAYNSDKLTPENIEIFENELPLMTSNKSQSDVIAKMLRRKTSSIPVFEWPIEVTGEHALKLKELGINTPVEFCELMKKCYSSGKRNEIEANKFYSAIQLFNQRGLCVLPESITKYIPTLGNLEYRDISFIRELYGIEASNPKDLDIWGMAEVLHKNAPEIADRHFSQVTKSILNHFYVLGKPVAGIANIISISEQSVANAIDEAIKTLSTDKNLRKFLESPKYDVKNIIESAKSPIEVFNIPVCNIDMGYEAFIDITNNRIETVADFLYTISAYTDTYRSFVDRQEFLEKHTGLLEILLTYEMNDIYENMMMRFVKFRELKSQKNESGGVYMMNIEEIERLSKTKDNKEGNLTLTMFSLDGQKFKNSITIENPKSPSDILKRVHDNMCLEDFDFSVRSYNCLKRAHIESCAQIVAAVEDGSILSVRNLGKRSVEEICNKLRELCVPFDDSKLKSLMESK